jgi:4-hydroxybenzoate polyprenyltransferase
MDGTLLMSDTLAELFVAALFKRPLQTIWACRALFEGRANLKRALADGADLSFDELPVRADLLEYLHREHGAGREIYLVSAADQAVAERVAARFEIFHGVHGSRDGENLKGRRKVAFLRTRFPGGFSYAGDASADLHIWRESASILIAGAPAGVARRARRLGPPVEAEFNRSKTRLWTWRKALRLHQWSKNALIFIPFLLGKHLLDPTRVATCVVGFLLMGLAASATYLINDLADLSADRRHRSKSLRPLAAGHLPVAQALIAAPLMLVVALGGMLTISTAATLGLVGYIALTLLYSFKLKRIPLLDAMALASLYTLRLIIGTVLAISAFSPWLLTFSVFFFFSMSLAKRHVEVTAATGDPQIEIPGRGYRPSDAPMTLSFGAAASTAAVLIMVQYMMAEAFPSGVYDHAVALWAAPLLVGLWICRIWLLAQRGLLDDDPVAFAVRDPVSLGMGVVLFVAFAIARFRLPHW